MTTAVIENRATSVAAAHAAHSDWETRQDRPTGNIHVLSASYAARAEAVRGRAAALKALHPERIAESGATDVGPTAPFDSPKRREEALRAPRLALSRAQLRQVHTQKMKRARALGLASPRRRFQLLTQWDGWVRNVGDTSFEAEILAPGRAGGFRRLDVQIPRTLVRKEDAHLLEEGAGFYYCIGRAWVGPDVIPDTVLWFRRYLAPVVDDAELRARAEALVGGVGWTD
jgi:hypothetical protein